MSSIGGSALDVSGPALVVVIHSLVLNANCRICVPYAVYARTLIVGSRLAQRSFARAHHELKSESRLMRLRLQTANVCGLHAEDRPAWRRQRDIGP